MAQYHEDERFDGHTFTSGELEGAEFVDCTFAGCSFTECEWDGTLFSGCSFADCRIAPSRISGTELSRCSFKQCALVGIDWAAVAPGNGYASPIAHLMSCQLKYNTFANMQLAAFGFSGSELMGCTFARCRLTEADFNGCVLEDTEFIDCNLEKADFRDATGWRISPAGNRLRNARFSLPEALALLDGLGIVLD